MFGIFVASVNMSGDLVASVGISDIFVASVNMSGILVASVGISEKCVALVRVSDGATSSITAMGVLSSEKASSSEACLAERECGTESILSRTREPR